MAGVLGPSQAGPNTAPAGSTPFDARPESMVVVEPTDLNVIRDEERYVRRELKSYHISFMTISAVLGAGLYLRSGAMLNVAGPGGVILAYILLGILAVLVMSAIGEMICLWPIPNALVRFPQTFVDEDLGIVIGFAYWLGYSISFSALLAAAASEADVWTCSGWGQAGFIVIPGCVVLGVNLFGVKKYGHLEVIGGSLKVIFILFVIGSMIVFNIKDHIDGKNFKGGGFRTNTDEASNAGTGFFIALQVGAFGFIGIETPAVTAIEASPEVYRFRSANRDRQPSRGPRVNKALFFPVAYLPCIVSVIYLVSALMAVLNVPRTNPNLPSEIDFVHGHCQKVSSSVFVIAANLSHQKAWAHAYTTFLVITAWSSSNTALYNSSRTLFAITRHRTNVQRPLGPQRRSLMAWLQYTRRRFLYKMGTTSDSDVPAAALFVSGASFIWVPLLQLARSQPIAEFIAVLTQMASVCIIVVWTFQCLAYLRFYKYARRHTDRLQDDPDLRFLVRSPRDPDYPWRSFGQPYLTRVAFSGCILILFVAGSAPLWSGWRSVPFVASFLAILLFFVFWLGLKLRPTGRWRLARLEHEEDFVRAVKSLPTQWSRVR